MRNLMWRAGALALVVVAAPCAAQSAGSVQAPAGYAPVQAPCVKQADGSCTPVSASAPMPVTTVLASPAMDRGMLVLTAATAQQLIAANAARRGFAVQNQSSGACYINGLGTATQDYHSLLIAAGAYYETPLTHVGVSAISIICAVANAPVYAREW